MSACRHAYTHTLPPPVQAEMYIDSNNDTLSNNTLYVIYIGGNDYLAALAGLGDAPVRSVLNYTTNAMEVLYDAGARTYAPLLQCQCCKLKWSLSKTFCIMYFQGLQNAEQQQ